MTFGHNYYTLKISVAAAGWAPPACVWRAVGHTHRRARGAALRHSSRARTCRRRCTCTSGGNACRWPCTHARRHAYTRNHTHTHSHTRARCGISTHARRHARAPLMRPRLHQGTRPAIRRTGRRRIRNRPADPHATRRSSVACARRTRLTCPKPHSTRTRTCVPYGPPPYPGRRVRRAGSALSACYGVRTYTHTHAHTG